MLSERSRKRKSSTDLDTAHHEYGPRRPRRLRLRVAGDNRLEAPASFSQPIPPPSSTAPSNPVRVLDEDKRTSPAHSDGHRKKEFSFFSFPAELRNIIYDSSLHYPDSRQLYAPYYRRPAANKTSPTWMPGLRAPTILLLNKRITNECLLILKSTTLVIDRLPPPRTSDLHNRPYDYHAGYPQVSHFMRLSDFISPRTLQSIPRIVLNVGLCEGPLGSGWAWMPIVDELLAILKQRNACIKLRLLIRLCNPEDHPTVAQSDLDCQRYMIKRFKKFAHVNPNVFARPEINVDMWEIEGQKATYVSAGSFPEPVLVLEDGEIYELDRPQKGPIPSPRMYPDREMFPGSVMEFVKPAPPPFYSNEDSD